MLKRCLKLTCASRHFQPPLGGCVLKPVKRLKTIPNKAQPPLGGCVLKHHITLDSRGFHNQPPLGGCVLKPANGIGYMAGNVPATFRRLCVETSKRNRLHGRQRPAAFRRLCVETKSCEAQAMYWGSQPPLGGCVLKRVRRSESTA